jgi:hypothetical protein
MKFSLIIILTISIPTISVSQNVINKTDSQGYKRDSVTSIKHSEPHILSKAYPTVKVGYMYSKWHSAEVGIAMLHLIGRPREYYGTMGLTLGSDFLFDKEIIFGPKLSAEANLMFLGTRLNATYYTADFKSGSFKIRPEIGLTLLGLINVFYGYTFNNSNPAFINQKHSISVFVNIPIAKEIYGH